jgi:hypothetical protein
LPILLPKRGDDVFGGEETGFLVEKGLVDLGFDGVVVFVGVDRGVDVFPASVCGDIHSQLSGTTTRILTSSWIF